MQALGVLITGIGLVPLINNIKDILNLSGKYLMLGKLKIKYTLLLTFLLSVVFAFVLEWPNALLSDSFSLDNIIVFIIAILTTSQKLYRDSK